jgi:hypothetical protein
VLSCGSTGTTAASDAHPASHPLPGVTGYRTPRSGSNIRRLPGRGGPPQFPPSLSMRSAPHSRGVLRGCTSRLFTASVAFALDSGLGSPCSRPKARPLTTPQASLHATDRTVAPPVTGPLTLGSDPARFQAKPPACYRASWQLPDRTYTGKQRRAYEHEGTPWPYVTVSPPALLGARIAKVNCVSAEHSHAEADVGRSSRPYALQHPDHSFRCDRRRLSRRPDAGYTGGCARRIDQRR